MIRNGNVSGISAWPQALPTRQVLEAELWILNTGARWHMLPRCCPNYKTVHRRFQTWCRNKVCAAF
ncbi:MAG: transposase [Methylocapsa sp.]|nr:transposase [Methylocapsa sp.]